MTTATFFSTGQRITGFEVRGHSGLAEEGTDVLCAAVTSAVRLTECAINDVLGLAAAVKVSQRAPAISLTLPGGLGPDTERTCQTLLAALMVYLLQLREEYPQYLSVAERDR